MHVNSIKKYMGSPIDFKDWELKTKATLGQTANATYLTPPPIMGDVLQEARNKELYNMFVTALMGLRDAYPEWRTGPRWKYSLDGDHRMVGFSCYEQNCYRPLQK